MSKDSLERYNELVEQGYTQSAPRTTEDSLTDLLSTPHAVLGPGLRLRNVHELSTWIKVWVLDIWMLLLESGLIEDPGRACYEIINRSDLAERVRAHMEADRVARELARDAEAIERIDRLNVRLVMEIIGETGVEVKGEDEWKPQREKTYTQKT